MRKKADDASLYVGTRVEDQLKQLLTGMGASFEPPKVKTEQAKKAEDSLAEFFRQAWAVMEPGVEYIHGWHIDAICEHLEAVSRGEIHKLLINMPPRHAKSSIVSVAWPAWEWIKRPWEKYLYASYNKVLSVRDSIACRRLIMSPWYQGNWGDSFAIVDDVNLKERFENTLHGIRIATSVGGAATGEGGTRVVVDDPHNAKEAESAVIREGVLDWWSQVMSTRLNDPRKGAYVVVMQRVHDNDLSGKLIRDGDYYHLCLPCRYEGQRTHWCIGWQDPRKKEGELLWPERFNEKWVSDLERTLGSYAAAAQLQQRPTPAEGGIFKKQWFRTYEQRPFFVRTIESWDTATSEAELSAYSVGQVWGETASGEFYLLHVERQRYTFPQLKAAVIEMHKRFNGTAVLVEDKSSGRQICQELGRGRRIPIIPVQVGRLDKVARAMACSSLVESGMVYIPAAAPWLADFMQEVLTFPKSDFKDQVDALTQALNYLRGGMMTSAMDFS